MISIIIPVYHHADALVKALASIARQTYKDIEVIVVDDGGDKKIRELLCHFERSVARCHSEPCRGTRNLSEACPSKDSSTSLSLDSHWLARDHFGRNDKIRFPISLFRQTHQGASAARNRGFRESKGEYVIFWDADVVAQPNMLEKMLKTLEEHPEANYAYCDYYFGWKKMPAGHFDPARLKKMNFIMTTSLMRREAFPDFDETLKRFQDWDLWLTMLEQGKIGVYVPETLFSVIPHKGGMSSWLPSFVYKNPWRLIPGIRRRVEAYDRARDVIMKKHTMIA